MALSFVDAFWHVAKAVLVSTVQVVLQQRRLRFAGALTEAAVLVDELKNYRCKVTPALNEVWSAREGAHDDVLARPQGFAPNTVGGTRLADGSRPFAGLAAAGLVGANGRPGTPWLVRLKIWDKNNNNPVRAAAATFQGGDQEAVIAGAVDGARALVLGLAGADHQPVVAGGVEAQVGGGGLLLCVTGEPGLGKTTLVEDFLAELAAGTTLSPGGAAPSAWPAPRLTCRYWRPWTAWSAATPARRRARRCASWPRPGTPRAFRWGPAISRNWPGWRACDR
jgi:hypothetical protein